MRAVFHSDVSNAARALYVLPKKLRGLACQSMIARAEVAHAYVSRTGALHPRWGDGSLLAVARRLKRAREPGLDDPDYCTCLIMVLCALHPQENPSERHS